MKSNTTINTSEAARIAKRLLNHWKHKFEVSETAEKLSIFMPDATVNLTPKSDILWVSIESTLTDLSHLEKSFSTISIVWHNKSLSSLGSMNK